jgi:hypothetical protein
MHPLIEVFGYPVLNTGKEAARHRNKRLCPFKNKVPNCTKDKAKDPLGVCSIEYDGNAVITCPVRFSEDWIILDDVAAFFFPSDMQWTSLMEVRLPEANGKSAGNIDVVLVSYDSEGKIHDFGALEIQAVYISGNVRDPFVAFMKQVRGNKQFDWSGQPNYPRPDFLSSSRKRLAPQLLYKGGILNAWGKKIAVVIQKCFFETLPEMKRVPRDSAGIGWFVYDLCPDVNENVSDKLSLVKVDEVYSEFDEALISITKPQIGSIDVFLAQLQDKLDEKELPPRNRTIDSPF